MQQSETRHYKGRCSAHYAAVLTIQGKNLPYRLASFVSHSAPHRVVLNEVTQYGRQNRKRGPAHISHIATIENDKARCLKLQFIHDLYCICISVSYNSIHYEYV